MVGLLPREFHCYGIGSEKTGTTTIAGMFDKNYRSGHETDPAKTTQLMIDYIEGLIDEEQVKAILRKRDKLLNLEMESAHPLIYVSDLLPQTFPEAKFIITIREPYSLLESRLNWDRTSTHPAWKNFKDYFFGRHHMGYEKEEEILKGYNLYSLDTYLSQYADHYRHVFNNIPEERRIFIKTGELNEAPGKIASFLGIDEHSLQMVHSNSNRHKVKILQQVDQSFVREKIWKHCSELIQRFFPDTIHLYN
jgi:hypothetical protein